MRDFISCFNAKVVELFDIFTVIAISQDEDRCICSILVAVFVGHSFGQGIITFFTLYYSLIINFVFSRTERKLKALFLCHHTKQKQNLFTYFLCLALFTNSFSEYSRYQHFFGSMSAFRSAGLKDVDTPKELSFRVLITKIMNNSP